MYALLKQKKVFHAYTVSYKLVLLAKASYVKKKDATNKLTKILSTFRFYLRKQRKAQN